MQVTGWTSWNDDQYLDFKNSPDSEKDVQKVIVQTMKENKYKFNGTYHIHGETGVPIIDGKYIYKTSCRGWGHIMEKVCDIKDEDGYGYVYWSWSTPNGEKQVYPV